MRDILFRGKRVDNEEWVYGNLITVYSYGEIVSTSIMGQSTVAENIAVRFDTVGQYTGLFDKNMNKVFEGDKVCVETLSSSCKPIKMSGVIERSNGVFSIAWDKKEYGRRSLNSLDFDKIEVIGNIYDTPKVVRVRRTK